MNFSELERAETKFLSDDVRRRCRRDERKRRVWKLLPDRKIFRRVPPGDTKMSGQCYTDALLASRVALL